jgi:signal transduction histidine kinase
MLDRIADLAEKTSREARQAVWDIRPAALGRRELVRAVEATARRTIGGAPLALAVCTKGRLRRLPVEVQGAMLRIVQEAVANAVRHAEASTVSITLAFRPRALRVTIADDGRGFRVEPDFRAYAGHWGLLGMRERAQQIGAKLRVSSVPGRGTTATLEVPLEAAAAERSLVARDAAYCVVRTA